VAILIMTNPIYLTSAPNDADLIPHLGHLCQPYDIQCGDFNFQGYWQDNQPVWIWGERKKLSDLVNCALDTGRFLRQIQDAHAANFTFFFTIIEALYRCGKDGLIEIKKGNKWVVYHLNPRDSSSPTVHYDRIEGYLNQINYYCNVRVYHTTNAKETANTVLGIYNMFQLPPEDHNSLKQFATSPDPVAAFLTKPSLIRRVAKEFPGVGWKLSQEFEKGFGCTADLCAVIFNQDIERLMELEGVGKKTAEGIIEACENG